SILTPKAFSKRSAISGETAALPWVTSESVARRMPRISAARVTVRPSASIISSRIVSPGWGGFFMLIVTFLSVIVLKIHIGNGSAVQPKRDPPITCHRNTVLAFATPFERMQFPPRHGRNLSQIIGKFQSRKNPLNLCSGLSGHTVRIVILIQRLQSLVPELSDKH